MKQSSKAHLIGALSVVPPGYKLMDKYNPALADAVAGFRKNIMEGRGVLPMKTKELVIAALEVAIGKKDGAILHAKKAIRAGNSMEELFEALTITMYMVGMPSWEWITTIAIKAAEEEAARIKKKKPFKW
jgi:alkylhydroperoxidase/carboxymuconolactone decarboxylase family protein YurZ